MARVRLSASYAPVAVSFTPLPRTVTLPAEQDWGALMIAAQDGNGGAYRQLLGAMRLWLMRYYSRRLPMAQVDDAVQDTLLAIHQKRHTYDPARPFQPWLAAVARHKWIDRLRSMARSGTEGLPLDIAVPDHERAVTSATVLHQLMAELKPAQADAIRLVKIEGYSVAEASAKTGQSGSLIKVNIHRGLSRLSAMIQGRHDDD